ncbi:MAG TPA: tripartite tricarboxylate transporter substrate binding protein [Burkholderiales bacterium]|nr:tripartite tricarboxylate transporter substrate binding protein [Burkholderiales bacterium]
MNKRLSFGYWALALSIATSCPAAVAAQYPDKPIRIIDPYAPGGSTEAQARVIGQKLTEVWGQPVVIDGRPGAASAIGTQIVAKSTPDGYTLLVNNAALATVPNLSRQPLFDPIKDLAPVIQVGAQPLILVALPSLPNNLKELLSYAKANPGKLNYGSAGTGGATHLSMEYLMSMAGIKLVHVPYKGSAPSAAAMAGGEVQLGIFSANSVLPHIHAGRLRALGVSTIKRSPALPDVPSIAEAGVPGYEVVQWSGIFAPAGTPSEIIGKLNRQINEILKLPDVKDRLARLGVDAAGGTSQQFAAFTADEVRKWAKVIAAAGIPRE